MIIFKKFFIALFLFFIITIIALSFILGYSYLSYAENKLYEDNKSFANLIAQQIETGYFESEWPYESLSKLTQNESFIFWWVIKEDGTIYRADDAAFIGANAFIQLPKIEEHKYHQDDEVVINKDENYAIYLKNLKLGSNKWKFVLGFSISSISKIINQITITVITISVLTIIILTGVLFIMVKKFTRPISELLIGTKNISEGNLEGEIKIKTKDEMGELAESFNKMTHDLKKARINIETEKTKLETLLNDLGEGVIATNLKGNILILNKEAERMFGKKMKECVGKYDIDFFNLINERGEKIGMENYPISTSIARQKTVTSKMKFIKNDGSSVPVISSISPIIFKNKIIGIIGIFRDITEEEKIDRAKTEFVSLASHQLKTPLTAMRWFLDILNKKNPRKDQKEYLQNASISTNRMIKLVGDFLDITRLESGVIAVIPKKGDFVEFAKGLAKEANAAAKKRGQKILFQPKEKKIIAEFDPTMISQVIMNLLSNAIHYSPDHSTIVLSVEKIKNKIQIKVKDSGFGMSPEDQKKLFTKFFRTQKSSQASSTGSGLGLYIIKKILDTCKGSIKCQSKENKGTTFTVILDLKSISIKGEKQLTKQRII